MTRTQSHYRTQLQQLLPNGPAWKGKFKDGRLYKLLSGLAAELARVESRARDLWTEAFINEPTELLEDYEQAFGVTYADPTAVTTGERQSAVHAKARARTETVPTQYYLDVLKKYNANVVARLGKVCNAGVGFAGAPITTDYRQFAWWLYVLNISAGSAIASLIESDINYLKHSHTKAFFNFIQLPATDGFEDPSWRIDAADYTFQGSETGLIKDHWTIVEPTGKTLNSGTDEGALAPGQWPTERRKLWAELGVLATSEQFAFHLTSHSAIATTSQMLKGWFKPVLGAGNSVLEFTVRVRWDIATGTGYQARVLVSAISSNRTLKVERIENGAVAAELYSATLAFVTAYTDAFGLRLFVEDTGTADQASVRCDANDGSGWTTKHNANDASAGAIYDSPGIWEWSIGQASTSTPHADDACYVDDIQANDEI